ncbi:MAG: hypothetical protein ACKVP7_01485 [Hyphomicrobiaceae bacterium]
MGRFLHEGDITLAPMKPERGQIIVTERLRPFLKHSIVARSQTDEGTVMIGDGKE